MRICCREFIVAPADAARRAVVFDLSARRCKLLFNSCIPCFPGADTHPQITAREKSKETSHGKSRETDSRRPTDDYAFTDLQERRSGNRVLQDDIRRERTDAHGN